MAGTSFDTQHQNLSLTRYDFHISPLLSSTFTTFVEQDNRSEKKRELTEKKVKKGKNKYAFEAASSKKRVIVKNNGEELYVQAYLIRTPEKS